MRVLIVDDHRLFAEAIRRTLEDEDLEVAIATTGQEAMRVAASSEPDLVLLDLVLPGEHGLEVGEQLLGHAPEAKLVALTAVQDPAVVGDAMRIGFHGFITKQSSLAELVPNVRAVLDGQVVLPHRLAPSSSRRPPPDPTATLQASHLTAREKVVLALLVEGLNGPQIARRLLISPNTVRTHVQSILTKLQVHSRLEAVAFAIKHRIVDSPRPPEEAAAG
jgi:two-component system nitrate/nitrite response regulator NarL